jgi:DUF4097 and DUF4098 domain-containing protein YvlB
MRPFLKSIFLIVFISLSFGLLESKTDSVEKRFSVDPGKQVKVKFTGVDGDVLVEKHDKSEIIFKFKKEMRGKKSKRNLDYFEKIYPELSHSGNTLSIEIKHPKRSSNIFRWFSNPRIKISSSLFVPKNTDLKVKVVDGDVDVSDLKGELGVTSVDGDLELSGCQGELSLEATDGDIDALDCAGSIMAHTVDGDVKISGTFSVFDFKSVDGDCNITLEKGSLLKDDCSLRAVDGDIRLAFSEGFDFKLNARTNDGRINIDDIEFHHVIKRKKNRFQAEKGESRYTIEIKTTDGDIRLKEV